MASVIDSVRKIYSGELAYFTHLFFVIIVIICNYGMFMFGFENKIASYVLAVILGVSLFGYFLKMMHNTIKNQDSVLPDFDQETLMLSIKVLPVVFGFLLISIPINVLLCLIPLIGPIISGVVTTLISSLMILMYCERFNYGDAFNFSKIKELMGPLFIPISILSLKLLIGTFFIIIPLSFVAIYIVKNNPFVFITIIFYLILIMQLAYYETLAQIYNEISYESSDIELI